MAIGHGLGNYKLLPGMKLIQPATKKTITIQVEAYGNTLHKGSWWVLKEDGSREPIPEKWLVRFYYPEEKWRVLNE
jgi:hypothetical protein